MGKGILRKKNAVKRQYLQQAVKYIEQLEKDIERLGKENEALKTDPNTLIGQFINQYRELYAQNGRLSTLVAALIKKLGESVTLAKDEMEAFKGNQINVKWELPEGVTDPEAASEFVFTYELQPILEPPKSVVSDPPQQIGGSTEISECTDPNCTLPKDLKHTHDVPVSAGDIVSIPDAVSIDEPQSGRVDTTMDSYDAANQLETEE